MPAPSSRFATSDAPPPWDTASFRTAMPRIRSPVRLTPASAASIGSPTVAPAPVASAAPPCTADGLTGGNILLFTAPMPNSLVAIGAWLARPKKGTGKSGTTTGGSYSGSKPVGCRRPAISRATRVTRRGIMSEIKVSVLSDIACRVGEGPTYDARTDTLFWFDIVESKLLEHRLSGSETQVH